MKLSQLRYFCAVCKYGNISKAAKELYMAQPSISIAIKELETELGVTLFTRYNNRLALTKEGTFFLEGAQRILEEIENLARQVKTHAKQGQQIRLAITPMLGVNFISPIIKLFQQLELENPGSSFEIIEQDLKVIPRQLRDGTIDFAIVNLDKSCFPKFQKLVLWNIPLKAYMGRKHPLAEKSSINFDQIKDQALITTTTSSVVRRTIENWFSNYGYLPDFKKHYSQMSTIISLLKNNWGILLTHCKLETDSEEIVSIPLEEYVGVNIGLIWDLDKALNNLTLKMIESFKTMPLIDI